MNPNGRTVCPRVVVDRSQKYGKHRDEGVVEESPEGPEGWMLEEGVVQRDKEIE